MKPCRAYNVWENLACGLMEPHGEWHVAAGYVGLRLRRIKFRHFYDRWNHQEYPR